jgi:hypothetical protein
MDVVLPACSTGVDRRTVVRLVLGGATGAALAEAGAPVNPVRPWNGPAMTIDSVQRTVTALAAGYYSLDPRKTGLALRAAEHSLHGVFAEKVDAAQLREAKATYARLLTMSATVATATGDQQQAIHTGDLAASLASEVGDMQTAGHAWSVVAAALGNAGKNRAALSVAQRARSYAGTSPAAVMALLEEACAAAAMGHVHVVTDSVAMAEAEHARLPADAWGTAGYPLGTYHPANVEAFAGWALAKAGMYSEATPRLDEAAELLSGSSSGSGLLAFVWLTQAGAILGTGDVDEAHDVAAVAVTHAVTRPSWSVAAAVAKLDKQSGGAFTDLVEQTSQWTTSPPGRR